MNTRFVFTFKFNCQSVYINLRKKCMNRFLRTLFLILELRVSQCVCCGQNMSLKLNRIWKSYNYLYNVHINIGSV